MTRLRAIFVGLVLIVGLAAYMLVMVPSLEGMYGGFTEAGVDSETDSQLSLVMTVALRVVPVIIGLGAIVYIYAMMVKPQRYHGRMP